MWRATRPLRCCSTWRRRAVPVRSTWTALADLPDRRRAVDAAADMLARLEGRTPARASDAAGAAGPVPAGSPFLEGPTVTVAGAALLQRVAGAVRQAGGNVLSSQVEVQGAQAKDGYVSLMASCDIDHRRCSACSTTSKPACRSCSSISSSRNRRYRAPAKAAACGCCSRCQAAGRARDERASPPRARCRARDRRGCGARRQSARRARPAAEQRHAGAGRHVAASRPAAPSGGRASRPAIRSGRSRSRR